MANCLVLGASGFIGSHLVDALREQDHTVRAFGKFSKSSIFEEQDGVEVVAGDFLNRSDLIKAVEGMDYVFHFISTTTPATAEDDPLVDIETNIRMSVELFQICVDANVKRVIFASTGGAIYGKSNSEAHKETDNPQPVSPYAIGKLTIEHYLRYFRVKHGLDSVTLRISNPYGERQPLHRKQGVIPIFLENVIRDLPITVLGDGSMVRDYIYVKDVAHMIVAMFDKPTKFDTYNLGSGNGVSVSELVNIVSEVTGIEPKVEHKPAPSTFAEKALLDTSRFTDEFGLTAQTELRTGVQATLAYIKQELNKNDNGNE